MEFLSAHQLNIMLFMSGICGILAFLVGISRALAPKRRRILTLLEAAAMFLLLSDWYAYRFRGEPGTTGFWMVRISNFLVFFLALFMIRLDGENWHTDDHVVNETKVRKTDAFPGWEEWKNRLRLGMDCRIDIRRDPRVITVQTENLGICIDSEISIHDFDGEIYAALTGDQCTITEIRIVRSPGGV